MKITKLIKSVLLVFILFTLGALILLREKNPSENETTSKLSTTPPVTQRIENKNIIISSPRMNAKVSLPIIITGKARVFENQFNYRIRDADQTILADGVAYANAPDAGMFGNFTIVINTMNKPKGKIGTIELFDYSAKDGLEIDTVLLPITFNNE